MHLSTMDGLSSRTGMFSLTNLHMASTSQTSSVASRKSGSMGIPLCRQTCRTQKKIEKPCYWQAHFQQRDLVWSGNDIGIEFTPNPQSTTRSRSVNARHVFLSLLLRRTTQTTALLPSSNFHIPTRECRRSDSLRHSEPSLWCSWWRPEIHCARCTHQLFASSSTPSLWWAENRKSKTKIKEIATQKFIGTSGRNLESPRKKAQDGVYTSKMTLKQTKQKGKLINNRQEMLSTLWMLNL